MPCSAQSQRLLILRLSPLRDVAASASHLFLADTVQRALPGATVSFAFLPPPGGASVFAAVDLVLVSNAFVLEAINLPWLLAEAGVAPWAGERPADFPAIVLGGSNALAAQCLVRPDGAAVPDAFFFGEGETALEAFLRAWAAAAGLPKRARLLAAAAVSEGFWVTGDWPTTPVRQAVFRGELPLPFSYPLLDTEAADTVRLQASYGCPAFCSFCFEGLERKPYRELPFDTLMARARRLKQLSGARAVELDAFNLNSHADLAALVAALARLYERVGFKSQRVDVLAAMPALLELELAAGKRSFTLGIEGVSARLRARLNKSLEDAAIEQVLRRLLAERVREVKLFYLASGDETAADLAEFDGFCRRLVAWAGGPARSTRLVFSFGRLVRMPNTPLRYDRLHLDRPAWDSLTIRLERSCQANGFECRMALSWDEYRVTQLLAAADYRVAPLVVDLASAGFHYDGRLPPAYAGRLERAMAAAGIGTAASVAAKPRTHEFPFAFVQTPVTADFLFAQYEAAVAASDRGYCLGDACQSCGACTTATERAALAGHPRSPQIPRTAITAVGELTRAKQRLPAVYRQVRLGAEFAGRGPAWVSARLLQAYLAARPDDAENVLSIDEWLFTGTAAVRERFPQPAGVTVVALRAWRSETIPARIAGGAPDAAEFLAAYPPADGSRRSGVPVPDPGRTSAAAGVRPASPAADGQSGPHSSIWGAAEVAWLGAVEACEPGGFKVATWHLALGAAVGVAAAAADAWLRAAHLAFTSRRDGDTSHFDLAPAARRKRVVSTLSCRPTVGGAELELVMHPKADVRALITALERTCGPVVATCLDWTPPPDRPA
jgi:hypothetical protein